MVRLNRKDVDAPYLIINGNLVNRGRPRAYESESNRPYRDNYNFEFTRDYTGSDGLGYIQSAGFGLPVVEAQTESEQPAWFNPRKVIVEDLTQDEGGMYQARRLCAPLTSHDRLRRRSRPRQPRRRVIPGRHRTPASQIHHRPFQHQQRVSNVELRASL